jgi:prophage regulatory protein
MEGIMVPKSETPSTLNRVVLRHNMPEYTGYSIIHIYRLIKAGRFPKPLRLGANRVAWLETDLKDWQAAKIAERDASGVAK